MNFVTKVLSSSDDVRKFWVFLYQQKMIKEEFSNMDQTYEINNHDMSLSVSSILENLPITDLLVANNECGNAGYNFAFRIGLKMICRLNMEIDFDYFFIDNKKFLKNNYDNRAIVLYRNGLYMGHCWMFTDKLFPDHCGVYGIKSSIVNIVSRKIMKNDCPSYRRGITIKLLEAVEKIALAENISKIIIPSLVTKSRTKSLEEKNFYFVYNNSEHTVDRAFLHGCIDNSKFYIKHLN